MTKLEKIEKTVSDGNFAIILAGVQVDGDDLPVCGLFDYHS
jgi:hypothetical protein